MDVLYEGVNGFKTIVHTPPKCDVSTEVVTTEIMDEQTDANTAKKIERKRKRYETFFVATFDDQSIIPNVDTGEVGEFENQEHALKNACLYISRPEIFETYGGAQFEVVQKHRIVH